MSLRPLLLALVSFAAACAAEDEALSPLQHPGAVEHAPAQPVAPKAERSDAVMLRPLYHDDWFGGVTLLGVDAKRMRAVIKLDSADPPRVAIDTIDLAKGERVERWEATGDQATRAMRGPAFTALSGSFDKDLSRYASLVGELGPWHLRQPLTAPTFAVAPGRKHVLFGSTPTDGSEGDWLFSMADDGKHKRVDHGLRASYSPVFSPDGERVAFIGCVTSPCDYGVFLARIGDDKPRRAPGIQRASSPMWTAAGDSVLTVGARGPERCLFRIGRDAVTPKALHCVKGLEDVSFAQDPDGRTAALAGVRGVPGKQVVDVTWILLADSTVLGTQSIDRAVGSSVLSSSGLMALPMQRGAVGAVDLVTGSSTIIPESEGWFFGFEGARWVGDSLIVLRKTEGQKGYDVVAIDVRKASGRRDEPWL